MGDVLKGSCCCGAIRFTLRAPPTMMAQCHCSRCRKLGASVFVFVRRDSVTIEAGEALIQRYVPEAPNTYARAFCARCGSALGELGSDSESYPIAADALDDDPGVRIGFHEFVAERPAWSAICDDARQFAGHPERS